MPITQSLLVVQHRRERGFTLIELMFTLLIFAVLLTVAAPAMQHTVIKNGIASHQKKLRSSLQHARSVAVDRGVTVGVCDSDDGESCNDPAATWEDGWIAFVDNDSDGVRSTVAADGEEILSVQGADSDTVTISLISLDDTISFASNGYLSNAAEFKFCHDNNEAKYARALILTFVGIVRSSQDSDNNDIHEDSAGDDLSCP